MNKTHFFKIALLLVMSLGSIAIVGGSFNLNPSLFKQAFNNDGRSERITDVSRYEEIRSSIWSQQELVKHFPAVISSNASNTKFIYYPGNLQGGSFLQLKMKLPQTRIKQLLAQYRQISQRKYQGGNTNDHLNQKDGLPTTFFYTGDDDVESFPPTYEILVLGARDKGNASFKWNHGNSYGIAIDRFASEIVYWAEVW
ncbi:hypothetical protein BC008_08095 [Mastigocoleus testarum BC008]|uniref:Uncharacterized protein n=2 Tax=Mastigocoleus TaxID=996924 RepID=A0A0V7ZBU3_9CYAN|nr:hypothetical protein BC008_08095 [Mastigocoleus testarum BC008]